MSGLPAIPGTRKLWESGRPANHKNHCPTFLMYPSQLRQHAAGDLSALLEGGDGIPAISAPGSAAAHC